MTTLWLGIGVQCVIVGGCALYMARRRSGLSVALLLGAAGNLIISIMIPAVLLLLHPSPQAINGLSGVWSWAGVMVGAFFAISLLLVLRRESAPPT